MDGSVQPPAQRTLERCRRCLSQVALPATRCQNCGQPLRSRHRGLMLWIGVGGVTVLAFVVGLMWLVVRNDDLMTAPPPVDEASQAPKQFPQFGDVSKAPDKSAQKEPDQPKQPPLNQ